MSATIPQLIINAPYEAPAEHWRYERETRTFHRVPARRSAAYVRATPGGILESQSKPVSVHA